MAKNSSEAGLVCKVKDIGVGDFRLETELNLSSYDFVVGVFVHPLFELLQGYGLLVSSSHYERPIGRVRFCFTIVWQNEMALKKHISCSSAPKILEDKNNPCPSDDSAATNRWFKIHAFEQNIGSFRQNKCTFGGIRAFLGGIGGNFSCFSLPLHDVSLFSNNFARPIQKPRLQSTHNDQKATENPIDSVSPILRYRHGGKFADSYGLLCIFASFIFTGVLIFWGFCRIDRGYRASGWFLFSLGLALGGTACASGMIGCLPRDWRRCLTDGEQHSYKQAPHIGNHGLGSMINTMSSCAISPFDSAGGTRFTTHRAVGSQVAIGLPWHHWVAQVSFQRPLHPRRNSDFLKFCILIDPREQMNGQAPSDTRPVRSAFQWTPGPCPLAASRQWLGAPSCSSRSSLV